jgi:hypothetical protein
MLKVVSVSMLILLALAMMYPVFALVGDVNHDGVVDIKDIRIIAQSFGATTGGPRWNPDADLNGDGVIDMKDLRLAAVNFGK